MGGGQHHVSGAIGDEPPRDRYLESLGQEPSGPADRFRRVLGEDPAEEQRWYAVKQAWFEERIREWLEPLGIKPVARKQKPAG